MNSLKLFDPFDQPLENFLHNFFGRSLLSGPAEKMLIRMDVSEDENAYTVRAEMPGVRKEDIQVSVDGTRVTLSATTKKEEEKKQDGKLLHSERHYGSLYRSFSLAQPVDSGDAIATYKDGVLELLLPKSRTTTTRQVVVQ